MTNLTKRKVMFAILEVLTQAHKGHKHNLLGRTYQSGHLENHLSTAFDQEERALAGRAFEQLRGDGLIEPTYSDMADPDDWVKITEAGRSALARQALDDLDEALSAIKPHLVEIRAGAWAAANSTQPDALRQAAHSGRELIDQTLKLVASDEEVRQQEWFQQDSSSKSGVTRRHRLQLTMQKRLGRVSKSDLRIAEKACDLALAVDDGLTSLAHSRRVPALRDVKDALLAAEVALRRVLLGRN